MSDKSDTALLNLNFETVGSIAAMLIGACALFVAWDQAQVMRKQQHASVWPLLSPDFTIDADDNSLILELSLANEGVGPALIESAYLTLNGEEVVRQEVLMSRLFPNGGLKGSASFNGSDIEGAVVGAGDEAQVFRLAWPQTEENNAIFSEFAGSYVIGGGLDVSVTTCYCSIFDRCFVSTGDGRPERVNQCPAPTNFFSTLLQPTQATEQ